MEHNKNQRTIQDRRESSDHRSEKFIKYFIPEEKEERSGKDRRKSDPDKGEEDTLRRKKM